MKKGFNQNKDCKEKTWGSRRVCKWELKMSLLGDAINGLVWLSFGVEKTATSGRALISSRTKYLT